MNNDKLTLDQVLNPGAAAEPEVAPEPDVNNPPVPENAPAPASTPEAAPAPEANPEPAKNPMKEVRDRLNAEQKEKNKIVNATQRFIDGKYDFKLRDFRDDNGNVDYDALIKAMDDADVNKVAAEKGISPEVQAEIDRIENEKRELAKERMRVAMDRALADLQTSMNLQANDINQFFKDSMALSKNPYTWLSQGGTLSELYYLVYREKITQDAISRAVEEARTEWEAKKAPVPPSSNPAKPSRSNGALSLDQLLNQAVNK